MALSPAAATGINKQNLAALTKTVRDTANVIPNAIQQGGVQTAIKVKSEWRSIMAAHGLPPTAKINRKRWTIGDKVGGKSKETISAFIYYSGDLHLIVGPTIPHIIGAKLLATRGSNYRRNKMTGAKERIVRSGAGWAGKAGRLGAGSAFGGSNRGVIGPMILTSKNRRGEITARVGKRALTVPTGSNNLRAYAFHPGTRGDMGAWTQSKMVAIRIGPQTMSREVDKSLASVWGKGMLGAARAASGGIT